MASLNRVVLHWRILGQRRSTFVALAIALCPVSRIVEAAPVTFAFEAVVTEINPSGDADFALPSEITLGQTLNGRVRFEPPQFFGVSGIDSEGAALSASVMSIGFAADQLSLDTQNDVGGGPVGNPNAQDSISVYFTGTDITGVYSTNVPELSVVKFELGLSGDASSFNPIFDSVADPKAWNRLDFRRMLLQLQSPSAAGNYVILAQVGPVVLIPEPASCCFLVIGAALFAVNHRNRPTL